MPSLKDIRKRISSVKSTRKITSAMKMVAAAKLRRAQESAEASRPYALKMNELIQNLSAGVDPKTSPLFRKNGSPRNVLIVVVSSDRGLCGGYNSNLFRSINRFIRTQQAHGATVEIMPLGRKANQSFKNSQCILQPFPFEPIVGNVSFQNVQKLAELVTEKFLKEDYDEIYISYNEFVSAIQYNQRIDAVLPLSPDEDEENVAETFPNGQLKEYTFEPNRDQLLGALLPKSISIQLLTAFYNAEASEHSARMTAMDNATKNASEMIDNLTLEYNRARQAYITRELVEIVSGAEALNG